MWRNIVAQAVPLIVAQLVQVLYNIVDRIYIGHLPGTGELALTGVGITAPVIAFITAFTLLFGQGGAPLCAIAEGAQDRRRAERILGNTLVLLMMTSVAVTAVCLLFEREILYLFGASAETYRYAHGYFSIYVLGTVFVMFSTGMNGFINLQGYPRVGMMTTILGAVINIVLDPIFIFALDMGISGAALATVLAQMASAVWVLQFFAGKKSALRVRRENLRPDGKLTREITLLGLTGFMMSATNSLVQIACNRMLGVFGGDLYISVMTVLNSVRDLFTLPVQGLTSGAQPVLGYNYGARAFGRVRQGIGFMALLGFGYTFLAWLEFGGAIAAARDMIDCAVQAIANGIDTRGDGFPLLLCNPVGADFEGVFAACVYVPRAQKKNLRVRDFSGKEIPCVESGYRNDAPESRKMILFEAKVPAYGYAVYRMIFEGPDIKMEDEAIRADQTALDNGILKVVFDDRTGAPASIVKNGRELLERGSCFAVYEDDRGAWGEHVFDGKECGSFSLIRSRVVEANAMRAVLRCFLEYGKSEMMVDYILEKGSDRLKVSMKLRNAEKQKLITWNIPTAAKAPAVYTETGFLAENKVNCDDTNIEHYQHRFAQIEDQSDGSGIAVINDCIYGFHQVKSEYRLILLRNSSFARGGRGYLEENLEGKFMNQGTYDYQFVLIPHEGMMPKKRLFVEADFLQMPVEYLGDSCHAGKSWLCRDTALQMELDNMHASVIKQSEEDAGALVVRVFETEGCGGRAVLKDGAVWTAVNAGPWQIRTVKRVQDGFSECNMLERQEEDHGNQQCQND